MRMSRNSSGIIMNTKVMARLAIAMLAGFLAATSPARALDSEWHWVRLQPDEPGWQILQGTTTVQFNGSTFHAALIQRAGIILYHFELSGTIDGNRVSALEEHYQTDAPRLTFQGTFERLLEPEDQPMTGWGKERIVLMHGAWVIELFRFVPLTKMTP